MPMLCCSDACERDVEDQVFVQGCLEDEEERSGDFYIASTSPPPPPQSPRPPSAGE